MDNSRVEIFVGIFLVIGFLAFGWLALQLGEVPWLTDSQTYTLNAEFDNISGLKTGGNVQIAGVNIGSVREVRLSKDDTAIVTMQIKRGIEIPLDSIASVKSQGIMGDKFIQLSIGGDEKTFKEGGTITDTESSIDLESLISKFAFGQVK